MSILEGTLSQNPRSQNPEGPHQQQVPWLFSDSLLLHCYRARVAVPLPEMCADRGAVGLGTVASCVD